MNLGIDPCLSNPCLNRGECIQLRYGRYKCECAGKFFWTEIDVYIFMYSIYIFDSIFISFLVQERTFMETNVRKVNFFPL